MLQCSNFITWHLTNPSLSNVLYFKPFMKMMGGLVASIVPLLKFSHFLWVFIFQRERKTQNFQFFNISCSDTFCNFWLYFDFIFLLCVIVFFYFKFSIFRNSLFYCWFSYIIPHCICPVINIFVSIHTFLFIFAFFINNPSFDRISYSCLIHFFFSTHTSIKKNTFDILKRYPTNHLLL